MTFRHLAPVDDSHRDRLGETFDAFADPVLCLDASGRVAYANPAALSLLGASAEIVGEAADRWIEEGPDRDALTTSLGEAEPLCNRDLVLRRCDGEPIAVSISTGALGPSTLLIARPRGDRAELERAHAELEHCVNALAHDLRSPLVALLGFSRLLRQDYGELLDETGRHFLERIVEAGRTVESLVEELLELSRIGQARERRERVDTRSVLIQLEAELKPRLEAESVELALPADPAPIFCDRTRLYQVFSNLIGNALDHMGPCERRRVTVDVFGEPGHSHVAVRDEGRGIPAEHHDAIFEVFRSFTPRSSDGRRGTGLGLAIVKKVAETCGGRAWVESRPGHGAAFHVTFPLEDAPE